MVRKLLRQLRRWFLIQCAPDEAVEHILELLLRVKSREESAVNDPESLGSLIRLYAHAVEKACFAAHCDQKRGHQRAEYLRHLLTRPGATFVDSETIQWAVQLLEIFDARGSRSETELGSLRVGDTCPNEFAALIRILSSRRSVRDFQEKTIPRDIIIRAAECASLAPTSCNRQAIRFFITLDPCVAREAHNLCSGRSGFSDFIPGFTAVCSDSNAYSMPQEYNTLFVDGALCALLFLLGCHTQGVGATLMAWTTGRKEEEAQLKRILKIPPNYEPVVMCAFGFPARQWPNTVRKPIDRWLSFVSQ